LASILMRLAKRDERLCSLRYILTISTI